MPTPYRSSNLAIPPSPFSPQLPVSPLHVPKPQLNPASWPSIPIWGPAVPQETSKWMWKCHRCQQTYLLYVTQRCILCDHRFCSGEYVTKRDRKTGEKFVIWVACESEFDYSGWKAWGDWRRDINEYLAEMARWFVRHEAAERGDALEKEGFYPHRPLAVPEAMYLKTRWEKEDSSGNSKTMPTPGSWETGCFNTCDYPSECRWRRRLEMQRLQAQVAAATRGLVVLSTTFGVGSPLPPSLTIAEPMAKDLEQPSRTFDGLTAMPVIPESDVPVVDAPSTHSHEDASSAAAKEATKKPTFDDLIESAKRRKRRSAGSVPSPLASNPPSPVKEELVAATQEASSTHTRHKTIDEIELDLKKTIGRFSLLLSGFVVGSKGSRSLEDVKGEVCVKGLEET